jgi:transcriptional accessory protein Tex/SPT6
MYRKFNINDTIKVKLTDYGKESLRKDYDDFLERVRSLVEDKEYVPFEFRLPKEDKEGYSEWQMWDLINKLGKYIGLGFTDMPFETTILLSKEYLR